MAAVSGTVKSFSTFHSSTTALPVEITFDIIAYASADALVLPMGGGVGMRRAHHPIASVSRTLRQLYLRQPYPARGEERAVAPIRCNIGGALHFDDSRISQSKDTQQETLPVAATWRGESRPSQVARSRQA